MVFIKFFLTLGVDANTVPSTLGNQRQLSSDWKHKRHNVVDQNNTEARYRIDIKQDEIPFLSTCWNLPNLNETFLRNLIITY